MEGNLLPPQPKMEDERPIQDKVVFRMGRALETGAFLAEQRDIFDQAGAEGKLPAEPDFEQFAVERIMTMLDSLRVDGNFNTAYLA